MTRKADAKLDLGPDIATAAEAEADEFGGNVYDAVSTTAITSPEHSSSESPSSHVIDESSSSPVTAVEGDVTMDIQQHTEEPGEVHQPQQRADGGASSPTREVNISGDDFNSDAM